MKTLLVTGASGFIGQYFIQALSQQSYQVRALIRDANQAVHLPNTVAAVVGDITKPASLAGCCQDVDTVFHLAGHAHAANEPDEQAIQQHLAINYQGTQHLLAEALAAKVQRFVYFSSVKAVGDSQQLIDEQWQAAPTTPYGQAKRKAEAAVLTAGAKSTMHVCILRPSLVYGPGCKGNLASLLQAIQRGRFLPLPDVANCRSMVSLPDLLQAAVLAASRPQANQKIYFVTDNIPYSTYQLYTSMAQALGQPITKWQIPLGVFKSLAHCGNALQRLSGRKMPFTADTFAKLFHSAHYSSHLISLELGFTPRYDLTSMLPAMIAHHHQHHGRS